MHMAWQALLLGSRMALAQPYAQVKKRKFLREATSTEPSQTHLDVQRDRQLATLHLQAADTM